MMSLDQLDAIRRIDSANFISFITGFPSQLRDALKLFAGMKLDKLSGKPFASVVLSGVGGSAIGAEFVRSRLIYSARIPVTVIRHYRLPEFVNETTLVIACSYSGNTEETLEAVDEAVRKKARVVVVTSGARLEEMGRLKGFECIKIPPGFPPRMAMGFSIVAILSILETFGLAPSMRNEIEESVNLLENLAAEKYGISIPEKSNHAKQIAKSIFGKFPVIYASCDYLEAVALRWREQIEENAKQLSGHFLFPEMTHNEIVGWQEPRNVLKQFVAFLLSDPQDHPRVSYRFNYAEKVIRKTGAEVIKLSGEGKSPLARMFSLAYLSDFVSYYLAILNNVNPVSIEVIDALKKELAAKVR